MRIMIAAVALMFAMVTTAFAVEEALTEEQVEGVQSAIRAMGCTVEDTNIDMETNGYEAEDVVCKDDSQYDVYLDKDFKVTNKVKE